MRVETLLLLITVCAEALVILDLKARNDKMEENNMNLRAHLDFIEKKLSEEGRDDKRRSD